MASRKKSNGSSRTSRRTGASTARPQRARPRRARLEQLLSTTAGRVLAVAAAVGTITGAIAGVLALLPKSSDVLKASFADVTANPETSLEQYDARARGGISGAAHASASAGLPAYTLLADTTSTATSSTSTSQEPATTTTTQTTGTTTETKPTTSSTSEPTSGPETTPSGSTETNPATLTTNTTPSRTTSTSASSPPNAAHRVPRRLTRKGAKRLGGRIVLSTPPTPYPQEQNGAQAQAQIDKPPPAPTLHQVQGALVTEGAGVPQPAVAAVLGFVTSRPAAGAAPAGAAAAEASTAPNGEPATSTTPSATAPSATTSPASQASIVLPKSCRTSACGATDEVEKALTYDPNPVKAAQAVAAIFNDSRAEVVGKRLYPVGAEVTYAVDLEGFAGQQLTLEWSLVDRASKRPLARPWWRDIVVAHIEPKLENESLTGAFWVPEPPERGDYLVHLVLLGSDGVQHASSYSAPAFH